MGRRLDRIRSAVPQVGRKIGNTVKNAARTVGNAARNVGSSAKETARDVRATTGRIWNDSREIIRNRHESRLTPEEIQAQLDLIDSESQSIIDVIRGVTTADALRPGVTQVLYSLTPMGVTGKLSRELLPHLRRAQVRVNTSPRSVINEILQNARGEVRGFQDRGAERIYNLNIPLVSAYLGGLGDVDGARLNPISAGGALVRGLRNTVDNIATGVMDLVLDPLPTLTNMATGIVSIQADPARFARDTASGVADLWNNSSGHGRIAGLTEVVANVVLIAKGLKAPRAPGAPGPVRGARIVTPEVSATGISAGPVGGYVASGTGGRYAAGVRMGNRWYQYNRGFQTGHSPFNAPIVRPDTAVGPVLAPPSGRVVFSGPVAASNVPRVEQFLEAARRGALTGPTSGSSPTFPTRAIDMSTEGHIIDRVAELKTRLSSRALNRTSANFAYAEVDIPGLRSEFFAHSQVNGPSPPSEASVNYDGFSFRPSGDVRYPAQQAPNELGFVIDRLSDSEHKIINDIANQLGPPNPQIRGTITLFTELDTCLSCNQNILDFSRDYPGITIEVIHNNGGRVPPSR